MSVYLGQDKVGVTYFEKANMYEPTESIMQDNIYIPWARPEGWPDLDSLNLEMSGTESFVYMTYRTGHVDDVCAFNYILASGTATIELGTITNGTFIANSTNTAGSGVPQTYWLTSNEGYSDGTIVIKATGRFTKFFLFNTTRADGSGTINYRSQPMLERIWYMPEMTYFFNGSSTGTTGNGTYTIERDKFSNGDGTALVSMYYAWNNCYNLQSLDISGLHTQNVIQMGCAFNGCKKLETLDVSNFNTSKLVAAANMFNGCNRIKQLDLRNWNTEKLSGDSINGLFAACYAVKEILGLENIYTNNITSFNSIFYQCMSLEDVSGIKNWNTDNVTNLSSLFYGCFSLKIIDMSNWNISKVTRIPGMFYLCRALEHIQFPQTQTSTLTGSMANIFYQCYNLQEIELSWIKPITNAVTNIGYIFSNCRSVKEINIPEGWDISGCIGTDSTAQVFSMCYKLEKIIGISNWDMSNYNYSLASYFSGCYSLKELDIKNWKPHPTTMYQAFYQCNSLEKIDLTGWNWENMTSTALNNTFASCYSLKEIKGIEHMGDSSNITSYASAFNGCYSLTSIPNINSWNPANVTSCSNMFSSCYSLKSLTITNWSLPKCTTITNMFRYCFHMRELELTGWSLPALNVNPDYIFSDMHSLGKCSGLPIGLNHRYQSDLTLPEDQWARIFIQLPTVSGKTIYISQDNINKLTDATKAIATNKGWTIAA